MKNFDFNNLRFPSIQDFHYKFATIEGILTGEDLIDHVLEKEWGYIIDNINIATPETLWIKYLYERSRRFIIEVYKERNKNRGRPGKPFDVFFSFTGKTESPEYDQNFENFLEDLTHDIWKYFWMQTLPDRIDEAFQIILQFTDKEMSDKYKRIRAIRTNSRKMVGIDPQPSKSYSGSNKSQKKKNREVLARDIWFRFKEYGVPLNESAIADYISLLFIKLNIHDDKGAEVKAVTIRTRYISRKCNPFKDIDFSKNSILSKST